MKFNKKTHKVIPDSLDKIEAEAFFEFLKDEIVRHELARENAMVVARGLAMRSYTPYAGRKAKARIEFELTAVTRHELDIRDIDALIEKVRGMYEREDSKAQKSEYE